MFVRVRENEIFQIIGWTIYHNSIVFHTSIADELKITLECSNRISELIDGNLKDMLVKTKESNYFDAYGFIKRRVKLDSIMNELSNQENSPDDTSQD